MPWNVELTAFCCLSHPLFGWNWPPKKSKTSSSCRVDQYDYAHIWFIGLSRTNVIVIAKDALSQSEASIWERSNIGQINARFGLCATNNPTTPNFIQIQRNLYFWAKIRVFCKKSYFKSRFFQHFAMKSEKLKKQR